MISWIFIGLVMTILFTPGPTNTLLASSGIKIGIGSSLKLIPAEALGYLIAISAWGILIGSIAKTFPLLPIMIKLISASYILYLAVKLWKTAKQELDIDQPTIRPRQLLFATLLNPKALLFASAIFPASAWVTWHSYLLHIAVFLVLVVPIAFFWIVFGQILTKNKIHWLTPCNLQRTASLILMSFSVPVSYSALTSLI
ncbi:LysE family transporter [Acinetobacter sp.]|uniref:LysE family translocator n=1 Tax=Acinetobacter sp. TaxID=472 RepID=UPI0031D0418B